MPLQIVRNDITKMNVDAIVNASDELLSGSGGADGWVRRAAGTELSEECKTLHGCKVGKAKVTNGYNLPCKYVIHTVGPQWYGGYKGEEELLSSCYRSSLKLAKEYGCESIAFPLISAGVFDYPKESVLKVAINAIGDFLLKNDMKVYLVIFDKQAYEIGSKLFADIAAYINDRYVDEHSDDNITTLRRRKFNAKSEMSAHVLSCVEKKPSLEDVLEKIDESFSEMLLRKIDEKGLTDVQCYKKANVDRKLFSKIKNDKYYKPSKTTAVAFGLALELSMDEMKDLIGKAGYSVTHASKFDIIVEYFVERGNYNVFEINEALFAFDQNLIGV